MADAHKNFGYSTVATAPAPAASGTSLIVSTGTGALFPTPPFNATIWPTGVAPIASNAEIVRVTAISTDTLTITRTQESTSARTIIVGDQIADTITATTLEQYLPLSGGTLTGPVIGLKDKGGLVFDVRAYGALGTGAGTDDAAINLAIAAASAGQGGTVFFGAGDFIISSTLTIPSNVSLRGSGRRATRLFKNGDTYPMITIAGTAGTNKEKITISDLSIEGNGHTGFGISAHFAQLIDINIVSIDGFLDGAIDYMSVQDSYFHQFTANTNHHATTPVISIYGSSGWNSNMIWFSQCRIEDFWASAVSITQGAGYTGGNNGFFFTDCKFETTVVAGDILNFDSSVEELHLKHIFLSAGGFKAGYSTPVNGIKSAAFQTASYEDIFMNGGGASMVRSVLDVASSGGEVVIGNLYLNVTPTVAMVNFTGTTSALYEIGLVAGATPQFAGTTVNNTVIASSVIPFVTTNNTLDNGSGKLSTSGTISPQQATTAAAPTYVKGAIYFDTTLNKLRVGGATAWETITST